MRFCTIICGIIFRFRCFNCEFRKLCSLICVLTD
ncbi:MAG: hypothetical protein F9K26_01625 [Ignavibacteriaceae bacterium]|nr:MAG: hypothetical protein F9K26_01625 [Ignavibacteriaceae bacterium]